MNANISDNIKVCRLCGQVSDEPIINIFDGEINNLHEKINEYLPITIKADDSLPLTSCITCTNTLLAFDQLVVTCLQANKYFEALQANNIQGIVAKLEEAESPGQNDEAFRSADAPEYKTFCIEEPAVAQSLKITECKYEMKQKQSKTESEFASTSNKILEKGDTHISKSSETIDTDKDLITIDNKTYFRCRICSKSFNSAQSYKSHQKIHTGERPYVCEFCGKQFRIIQGLRRHIVEIHAGIKKFQCDLCERSFKTKQCVVEHRNIHTNERPYVCDVCGKAFRQKSSLFVHNRVHTNEFPFSCEHCAKAFRTKHLMIRHSTVHTGEKPHACDVCGKTFRSKNELNRHKYVHSDWKPFKCDLCGLSFRMNRYLKKHLKSNHNSDISVNNLCTL